MFFFCPVLKLFFFFLKNVSMGIPAKSIQNGMNKSSEIAQHLYPQLLERVAIINAPWFMKQLWKIARMILSERLTSKAAMCMGQFEPGKRRGSEFIIVKYFFAHRKGTQSHDGVPLGFQTAQAGGSSHLCRRYLRQSFYFSDVSHACVCEECAAARIKLVALAEWPMTTTLQERDQPRKNSRLLVAVMPQRRRKDGFGNFFFFKR